MTNDWETIEVQSIIDENARLRTENEQLKSEKKDMQILINTISDQRNEFHRGARENANRVGKLEKENEQLKSDLRYWRTLAQSLAKKNNVGDFE